MVSTWTFLSNHAHVLLCIAIEPEVRLRDVAERVGITERAVQKIVGELEAAGALTRLRDGRRNRYVVHLECPLRHPIEAHQSVGKLLGLLMTPAQLRALARRRRELEATDAQGA
ncbi:helix-turn-helix transcriptional regulator [Nannocystaceae bacterium ST9]